jgi:AP-4 complex subunit epsilon-1
MSGSHLSREFFDLVKAIGECRSKQEEDKIIESETYQLKMKFSDVTNLQNPKKLKELLIRSIYVEMLGHDASTFAYIHGVNLCSYNKSLVSKRVGYLVSCLFLDPKNSELMILLINTIQKDLRSTNLLEVSFALIVVSRLANVEMVPVLGTLITPLLSHAADMIRRRAVVAFHRLVQVGGDVSPQQIHQVVRKSLCDSDPGVMAVGLNLLQDLVNADPGPCTDLIPSIVGILKQVIEHRLPKDFDYHRMPAPWIQLRLISILAVLASSQFGKEYPDVVAVIQETMRRADLGSNAGAAVAFECVKCAAAITPNHTLLEHASLVVSRFMASDNHNYKYMGVTCLSLLVGYANEHQMLVVECLEDSDETLRRRTIELLTQMTNVNNVTVVVEKMLTQLGDTDIHFKRDLASRICSLCERFAPSNEWYMTTINQVLSRVPNKTVPQSVTENLTRLVAEQEGPDEATGTDLRVSAANEYIGYLEKYVSGKNLEKRTFSDQFVNLIAWMVGEFATMTTLDGYSVDDVVDLLIQAVDVSNHVMATIITAIAKLAVASRSQVTIASATGLFNRLVKKPSALSIDIETRCRHYLLVLSQPENVQRSILPLDASCEDIRIDLSFLDRFCNEARRNGAREYSRPAPRPVGSAISTSHSQAQSSTALSGLKFDPYEAPKMPSNIAPISTPATVASPPPVAVVSAQSSPVNGAPRLNVSGAKRWGQPSQPPAVAVTPASQSSQPQVQHQQHNVLPKLVAKSEPVSQPVLSKEYLEKQRMAAALFSGASPKIVAPSPSVASSKKSAPVLPVKPDTAMSDLLDIGGDVSNSAVASNVATKTTSREISDDLLDL